MGALRKEAAGVAASQSVRPARPQAEPIDVAEMYGRTMARFPETMARLAK